MNIVPKAGLTIYINDSEHKKVSFVRINRVSGPYSMEICALFRVGTKETVCYIRSIYASDYIWLHTGVSRAGFHCIFVQQCVILGFISFGLRCVFVNFSWGRKCKQRFAYRKSALCFLFLQNSSYFCVFKWFGLERDWNRRARLGRDTKRACENRRVRLARFARVIVHTYMRFARVICNSFRIKRGARWMPHNSTVVNTFLRTAAETLSLVRQVIVYLKNDSF